MARRIARSSTPISKEVLFLEEVRLLAPHLVVFQGVDFDKARFRQVRDAIPSEVEWHVLVHPSWRGRRRPQGHHAAATEQHGPER
ncbi:hypothetical protein [Candidatus Palauibacter sp.]|uniref:hypothetical protein n=1 Tax=Candidatus Palauibacter sp. TaxID=3101350 RepID=UPI003AF21CDF